LNQPTEDAPVSNEDIISSFGIVIEENGAEPHVFAVDEAEISALIV
jgi:hypothetical protein